MPGVGISRCIITLEQPSRASPPPATAARAVEAPALPPAHHSASVMQDEAQKERTLHGYPS